MNNIAFSKSRKLIVYITHNSLYKSSLRLLILRGFIWDSLCLDVAFRLLFEVKQLCGHGGGAAGEVIYVIPKVQRKSNQIVCSNMGRGGAARFAADSFDMFTICFATVKIKETQKIRCTKLFF